MGLFKRKKRTKPSVKAEDVVRSADDLFDESYRAELREIGKNHFQKIISENTSKLSPEVNTVLSQMTVYLKEHLARQLDLTIARVNADMTKQLNERMSEFNRVASESQELVTQSLSRNAQIVHEKYQQMSSNLQQIIASQEVMMATVFQDNKARVANVQSEQDRALRDLDSSLQAMRQQTLELADQLKIGATDQANKLNAVYQGNIDQLESVKSTQAESISAIRQTVTALSDQYQSLRGLLDESLAQQKKMVAETVNDNTARIIEHYLVGALGEQSDIKSQLPSIMESLEENKQAMMDDINL